MSTNNPLEDLISSASTAVYSAITLPFSLVSQLYESFVDTNPTIVTTRPQNPDENLPSYQPPIALRKDPHMLDPHNHMRYPPV